MFSIFLYLISIYEIVVSINRHDPFSLSWIVISRGVKAYVCCTEMFLVETQINLSCQRISKVPAIIAEKRGKFCARSLSSVCVCVCVWACVFVVKYFFTLMLKFTVTHLLCVFEETV